MAFCTNCGKELAAGMKFCPSCGRKVDEESLEKQKILIYDETKKDDMPPSLLAFISELDEYEKLIENDLKYLRRGWKNWNYIQRFLWVILNIMTSFVPWAVYSAIPLFQSQSKTSLTAAEKRKETLIRNFTFSNDGETLIKTLLFMKSQMEFLAAGEQNQQTIYWEQLWMDKAKQLHDKSRGLVQEGKIAEKIYMDMVELNRKIEKTLRIGAGIAGGVSLISLALMFVLIRPAVKLKTNIEADTETTIEANTETTIEANTDQILAIENFTFSISDYWYEKGSKPGCYQFYAETGGKLAMLTIECPVDDEEVSMEALYADNENMIKAIEEIFSEVNNNDKAEFDGCKVSGWEEFESDYGVKGILYTYTFRTKISGRKYNTSGKWFCFPSIDDNRWFFVQLSATNNTTFNYEDDYMKILSSIREKP